MPGCLDTITNHGNIFPVAVVQLQKLPSGTYLLRNVNVHCFATARSVLIVAGRHVNINPPGCNGCDCPADVFWLVADCYQRNCLFTGCKHDTSFASCCHLHALRKSSLMWILFSFIKAGLPLNTLYSEWSCYSFACDTSEVVNAHRSLTSVCSLRVRLQRWMFECIPLKAEWLTTSGASSSFHKRSQLPPDIFGDCAGFIENDCIYLWAISRLSAFVQVYVFCTFTYATWLRWCARPSAHGQAITRTVIDVIKAWVQCAFSPITIHVTNVTNEILLKLVQICRDFIYQSLNRCFTAAPRVQRVWCVLNGSAPTSLATKLKLFLVHGACKYFSRVFFSHRAGFAVIILSSTKEVQTRFSINFNSFSRLTSNHMVYLTSFKGFQRDYISNTRVTDSGCMLISFF